MSRDASGRALSRRDAAFDEYARRLRRILRAEPAEFRVTASRLVAASADGGRILEVAFHTRAVVEAGDMLHVWWHPRAWRPTRIGVDVRILFVLASHLAPRIYTVSGCPRPCARRSSHLAAPARSPGATSTCSTSTPPDPQ